MVCPVCTIAVAAGVGVLRELGVDDTLTGIWLGALIVSAIMWTIDYLNRKNVHFLFRKLLVIVLFYALFLIPLYYLHIMGTGNVILGIDRLLFGTILGTIIFILAVASDAYLRRINDGQIAVSYQKVWVPVVLLTISSIIAYLLLRIAGV